MILFCCCPNAIAKLLSLLMYSGMYNFDHSDLHSCTDGKQRLLQFCKTKDNFAFKISTQSIKKTKLQIESSIV